MRDRLPAIIRRLSATAAFSLLASVGALAFGSVSGCADQGEGERCTFFSGGDAGENGTSECASGLTCTPTEYFASDMTTTLAGAGAGTLGVCCPPSGTTSTAAACQPTMGGSTNGGPPSGDGSFDGSGDTGADASKAEAGKEAGAKDAGKDGTTKDATTKDAKAKDAKAEETGSDDAGDDAENDAKAKDASHHAG